MNKEIKNFNIDGIAIPYNTSIMIAGEKFTCKHVFATMLIKQFIMENPLTDTIVYYVTGQTLSNVCMPNIKVITVGYSASMFMALDTVWKEVEEHSNIMIVLNECVRDASMVSESAAELLKFISRGITIVNITSDVFVAAGFAKFFEYNVCSSFVSRAFWNSCIGVDWVCFDKNNKKLRYTVYSRTDVVHEVTIKLNEEVMDSISFIDDYLDSFMIGREVIYGVPILGMECRRHNGILLHPNSRILAITGTAKCASTIIRNILIGIETSIGKSSLHVYCNQGVDKAVDFAVRNHKVFMNTLITYRNIGELCVSLNYIRKVYEDGSIDPVICVIDKLGGANKEEWGILNDIILSMCRRCNAYFIIRFSNLSSIQDKWIKDNKIIEVNADARINPEEEDATKINTVINFDCTLLQFDIYSIDDFFEVASRLSNKFTGTLYTNLTLNPCTVTSKDIPMEAVEYCINGRNIVVFTGDVVLVMYSDLSVKGIVNSVQKDVMKVEPIENDVLVSVKTRDITNISIIKRNTILTAE